MIYETMSRIAVSLVAAGAIGFGVSYFVPNEMVQNCMYGGSTGVVLVGFATGAAILGSPEIWPCFRERSDIDR